MNAEQENTFRSLKEQDLLVTSSWCWLGFHKWTKWREPVKMTDYKSRSGFKYYQERRCAHCNKYEDIQIDKHIND